MIVIESHRKKLENIKRAYPGAIIHDVTSHATDEFIRFSPFYPNHGIPVPFSPGFTSESVEGVWQGLKVFETVGCDPTLFRNKTMKDLKRTQRRFGHTLGHRKGVGGTELLDYIQARKLIYLPTYKWILDNRLQNLLARLKAEAESGTVILLDYETNGNVDDRTSPLSHASLIKAYIENNYPLSEGTTTIQASKEEPVQHLEKGMKVTHAKFGEGVVRNVDGDRVQVDFNSEGLKTLAIRLAKLEIRDQL